MYSFTTSNTVIDNQKIIIFIISNLCCLEGSMIESINKHSFYGWLLLSFICLSELHLSKCSWLAKNWIRQIGSTYSENIEKSWFSSVTCTILSVLIYTNKNSFMSSWLLAALIFWFNFNDWRQTKKRVNSWFVRREILKHLIRILVNTILSYFSQFLQERLEQLHYAIYRSLVVFFIL